MEHNSGNLELSAMKKSYLIVFALVGGIALYSIFASNKNESEPAVPGALPPAAVTNSAADGINPEHGMPGHRCDIMVGAPLPAANSSAPVSAPSSTAPQAAPVRSTPAAGVKINPEHGQPGHRCDLNVGDPLP